MPSTREKPNPRGKEICTRFDDVFVSSQPRSLHVGTRLFGELPRMLVRTETLKSLNGPLSL